MAKRTSAGERRKYIRLDSVFPVNFRLVSRDDNRTFLSDWIQGFTHNISAGGICLTVNNLKPEFVGLIRKGEVSLLLDIQIPLSRQATPAQTRPTWIEPDPNHPGQFIIGVSYTQISSAGNKRILGYARTKYLVPRLSAALLVTLVLVIGVSGYFNWQITSENRRLVRSLVEILEEAKYSEEEIRKIMREKEELAFHLERILAQIRDVETARGKLSEELERRELAIERKEAEEEALREDLRNLSAQLKDLGSERDAIKEELHKVKEKETAAAKGISDLETKKTALAQVTFDNMYQWLIRRQNPRSGLILSFEGDHDLTNWAFTYDQGLVAMAFSYFGDFSKSQRIFDFYRYKAKKVNGGFLNAYYTSGEPAEYIVHCGPNIWLGLAVLQYTKMSGDRSYLDLAKEISDWLAQIQDADKDGGISGGPGLTWYATEHNLDAYAFFNIFFAITGNPRYKERAQALLNWLIKYAYGRPDVPIKRGKADATIATDTYAWSIAAIGPMRLKEIGMHPGDIMDFAEEHCRVEVDFRRPDSNVVRVKGFDFAAQRHLPRGGVVSTEWTAQMILSFKILADFYYDSQPEKALLYRQKADDYLWQLSRMVISSPSPTGQGRGCLPYASADSVDTGHGWFTPKGSSTGSVSGTTYTLFAYYGWNPLELN